MSEMEKAENLKPTWQQAESLELREKVLGPPRGVCFPGSPSQARPVKRAREVKVTKASK